MKICVSSSGSDLKSILDLRFGRCSYFIFYDTESRDVEAVENSALSASHGAGIQAAQIVLERRPQALITANLGPNAASIFSTAGLNIFLGTNASVIENIQMLQNGKLESMQSATVSGHESVETIRSRQMGNFKNRGNGAGKGKNRR